MIQPVPEAGGNLCGPYCKIVIEGTERALAATSELELTTVPAFTGADEQLWSIQQATDGTFRLLPKRIPGREGINTRYVLHTPADSSPTIAEWDFASDNAKWNIRRLTR